jgi:competence protein ComEA
MGGREPIGALRERFGQTIVIVMAALLAAALVALAIEHHDGRKPLEITAQGTPTAGGPIEVYITGAVMQPGVYEMQDGDRVVDLLYKAGGQAPDANIEAINLAVRLHDEDQVVVPRAGQAAGSVTNGQSSQVAGITNGGGLININTASAGELDALPGIGEVYSQRIVESRAANGLFASPDDLVNRQIIPRGTYDKIRDMITTGP